MAKKAAKKKDDKFGNLPGPGPGRPKGALNALTTEMKHNLADGFTRAGEIILAETTDENGVGPYAGMDPVAVFVADLAIKEPKAAVPLLARLVPGESKLDVTLTKGEDLVAVLNERFERMQERRGEIIDVTPEDDDGT